MKAKIYTQRDVVKAFENGKKAGVRQSLDAVLAVVTLKLQDKHGWTKEQLNQLGAEVNSDFESVLLGRLTLNEILEAKEQEVGE